MILLVHLSDIHLKKDHNPVLNRKQKIFDTFKNRLTSIKKVFFVITGDIAYSGINDEYNHAKELLSFLKSETDKLNLLPSSIITVPGNHDCCFDRSKDDVRNLVIDKINTDFSTASNGYIDNCCECQVNYTDFVKSVSDEANIVFADKLLTIYKYDFKGKVIQFNCLNTAWMSKIHESQGKIGFPVSKYDEKKFQNGATLTISLLHHPHVWHNAINAREVDSFLQRFSGIILTGHEHQKNSFSKNDLLGTHTEYIEGGVLQDSDNDSTSDFNIIVIDIDNKLESIINYSLDGDKYSVIKETRVDLKAMNGIVIDQNQLTKQHDDYLNDPGVALINKYTDNIKLSDIYVFPDAISLKINKINIKNDDSYSTSAIIESLPTANKVLVQGGEKYGKTTFCKIAFMHLQNLKFIPILVPGTHIKGMNVKDINDAVGKSFIDQYQGKTREDFNQLDLNKVYLIIDDFDKCRLNTKFKGKLLANIANVYENILLTVGELFKIEEIVYDENNKEIVLDKFEQHRLLMFGNVLRAELIEKWNKLGREQQLEEEEHVKLNDTAIRLINTVIGKNIVPSYPIFILTLLQSIETGNSNDLKSSSQGHYYNYLITHYLGKLKLKSDQINAYYTCLAELAYLMFAENIKSLGEADLKKFYKKLTSEYVVIEEYSILVDNLLIAKVLDIRNHEYCFKYKYAYYFFVAKHLADNINEPGIKTAIDKMAKRAYNEEFANILMLLTHHSKDPYIIDTILESAKDIFSDLSPIKFEEDVNILNQLTSEIPKLVLEDKNVHEARRDKLKKQDDFENIPESDLKQNEYTKYDINEDIENLDLVRRLNLAFKTVEILGQLVKNYYGAVKKEKTTELATETYLIALRALKSFYVFLEKHLDVIVNEIKTEVAAKNLIEKGEIEKFSREMLFFLSSIISFGFIKKVSNCIGAEDLDEIYEKVYEKNHINSVDMINISITMDFGFTFPITKVNKIKEKYGHHHLVLDLLRKLAINYLYMFPVDYKEKQQICTSLDIPMETQRYIDATSTHKKLIPL